MILFYAVNRSGTGCVFVSAPERDEHFKCWKGEMLGFVNTTVSFMEAEGMIELPDLKWSDEPVRLELNVSIC